LRCVCVCVCVCVYVCLGEGENYMLILQGARHLLKFYRAAEAGQVRCIASRCVRAGCVVARCGVGRLVCVHECVVKVIFVRCAVFGCVDACVLCVHAYVVSWDC
jgi:hypothetical protein